MKFLIDQDVYATTARFIADLGHDIVRVVQIGLSQADDEELLKVAQEQGRILVTRDRDFGSLVFVRNLGSGVLYLRILPSTQNAVHGELERVLKTHPEEELMRSYVVVEPDGHRIRRLPEKQAFIVVPERLHLLRFLLGLVVVTGLIAGFMSPWWRQGQMWTSLALLIVIGIVMNRYGKAYFASIAGAARCAIAEKKSQSSLDAFAAARATQHPIGMTVIGIAGLAIILWLMMFKP